MTKEKEKENDLYVEYFDENAPEDLEDIINICTVASTHIRNKFNIKFDDYKLLGATFSKIFDAFLFTLKNLEKEYSDFEINVANRLCIGYDTTKDEDDEKIGNFMIFIRHLNSKIKDEQVEDSKAKAYELAVQWNADNIKEQPEIIRKISINALEQLKTIKILLGTEELIIPIFISVYESIVDYIKIKRRELDLFEYEINFMSCFYIGCRESEDELADDIYIRPSINSKLSLKDDSIATAKYDA